MKILKIEKGMGSYRLDGEGEWTNIDEIDKTSLLTLLDVFLGEDVEVDSPEEMDINNPAQLIIYKNIFEKLTTLRVNKGRFKDESDRMYLDEIKKYSIE